MLKINNVLFNETKFNKNFFNYTIYFWKFNVNLLFLNNNCIFFKKINGIKIFNVNFKYKNILQTKFIYIKSNNNLIIKYVKINTIMRLSIVFGSLKFYKHEFFLFFFLKLIIDSLNIWTTTLKLLCKKRNLLL